MILMVTEKAVTVREYRFRLVQKCKNAVKYRLSGDEILKIFWGRGTLRPCLKDKSEHKWTDRRMQPIVLSFRLSRSATRSHICRSGVE